MFHKKTLSFSELLTKFNALAAENSRLKDVITLDHELEVLRMNDNDYYRELIDSSIDYRYTVICEPGKTRQIQHHKGCETICGYTLSELDAAPELWLSLIHPEDKRHVEEAVRMLLQDNTVQRIAYKIRHKDGTIRYIENTLVPNNTELSHPIRYTGLIRDVTEQTLAKNEQLFLGGSIQSSYLPDLSLFSDHPSLSVAYGYTPLESISGDVLLLSNTHSTKDRWSVFISDISGHGVSAGMFTLSARDKAKVLIQEKQLWDRPAEVVRLFQKNMFDLMRRSKGFYSTALYGYFTDISGPDGIVQFNYSIAGCPSPVLYRAKDCSCRYVKNKNTHAFYEDDQQFHEHEIMLEQGDRLFLFTDGVIERQLRDGSLLIDHEDWPNTFTHPPHLPIQSVIDSVLSRIAHNALHEKADDDVTLVGFQVK